MMMKKVDLTEAEWNVMECLWEQAPMTGREAVQRLNQRMDWSRSTTLTLLRRLEAKGAVASDTSGERKVFLPLIGRDEAALQETEDFLSRVYHGSLSLMVSSLVKKQSLSQQEIDELYAILQNMEEQKDD